MGLDYLRYYDLERYLFEDVHCRFHDEGSVGAFEFFSVVIWKASRAKSKIAKRLLTRDPGKRTDFEPIVRDLTRALHDAPDARSRLQILLEGWGFYLPMACAILSVFWPDEFSVYDRRVCNQLGRYAELTNKTRFEEIWAGYREYLDAVRAATPPELGLRDKDRCLWAKSTAEQLVEDLARGFQ